MKMIEIDIIECSGIIYELIDKKWLEVIIKPLNLNKDLTGKKVVFEYYDNRYFIIPESIIIDNENLIIKPYRAGIIN